MSTATFQFNGKKVLVTGASKGIGNALCRDLSAAGAKVFAMARDTAALEKLSSEVENIVPIVCDVTSSVEQLTEVLAQYQPFDCLVNNAGVAILHSILECTTEEVDKILTVNLRAPLMLTQVVVKEMIKHKIKGSIVNVSSQAGLRPLKDHPAYCSSKAGLDMLTRCMALEFGEHGIRTNNVNPTVVMTDMGRMAWADPEKARALLSGIPLGRFAEVEEVTSCIMFLLSEASAMTTGTFFPIDGGYSMV